MQQEELGNCSLRNKLRMERLAPKTLFWPGKNDVRLIKDETFCVESDALLNKNTRKNMKKQRKGRLPSPG